MCSTAAAVVVVSVVAVILIKTLKRKQAICEQESNKKVLNSQIPFQEDTEEDTFVDEFKEDKIIDQI